MDKMNIQSAVQDRLERLLEIREISKAELARRSGLPSRTVENYFKGHTPSLEALISIAKGNQMPLDWFLGYLAPVHSKHSKRPLYVAVNMAVTELLEITELSSKPTLSINWNGEARNISLSELAEFIANNAVQKYSYLQAANLEFDPED